MEKVLVIQTAFIGDAVLTLPMIQKLKEINSDTLIDVICIPSTEEIFKASPAVNETVVLDKRGKHKSIFKMLAFSRMIRERNYSKIYSPHRSFRSAFIVMQSRVKETYGFDNSSMFHVYKYLTHYQLNQHEVERNLALIGLDCKNDSWKIFPKIEAGSETIKKVSNFTAGLTDKKIAAIAPGTIWNTKKYPIEYLEEVIKFILSRNYFVILIGSEKEKEVCSQLASSAAENIKSAAGLFSIIETIELLGHCDFLITNDSAPTHFAMAAGIKTLTIYCSTVPDFGFYPYNEDSTFVSYNKLDCKPCGIHGYDECPLKHFNCGYKLPPADIIKKLEQIIV